jgi:hypothetical protein
MDETSHKAFVKIADGVDAKIACGQGRRFMKRQTCAARLTQLAKEVGQAIEDGTLALAHNKDLAIVAAQPEVAAAVAGFPAVVGLLLTGYYITHTQPDGKIAAAYTLPKEMVNTSGSNKEKSCPQTELKCKDCKGSSLGVCAYPWPGCPCTKPKECPDPQPECPDEKCKGEGGDNMCTTDELKGCPCKFKCPWEPEKMPNCEDCGGDTGSQTCKAVNMTSNFDLAKTKTFAGLQRCKQLRLQRLSRDQSLSIQTLGRLGRSTGRNAVHDAQQDKAV